ncbi:hypothetical protein [Haloarchaeobius sp. DFWS5]|uniref:hypothetical protein n=1 Tax=Haloarchaeobius sp. DFWS5 TaxID=3446114 RepID=UPI003EBD8F7B
MATFYHFVVSAVVYAVWMLCYAVVDQVFGIIVPMAQKLDPGGMMSQPVGWMDVIRDQYPLMGLLGIFITVLGVGVLDSRGAI